MQINDDALKVVVVGNFDIAAKTATVNFPANGTWYDYFNKSSVNITGGSNSITLQPGQYHVFFNKDLSNTLITSLSGPALPEMDGEARIFPNPVTNGMKVSYSLPVSGLVQLNLLTSEGKNLGTLAREVQLAGKKEITISESILQALGLRPGIYTVLIRTANSQKALRFTYRK